METIECLTCISGRNKRKIGKHNFWFFIDRDQITETTSTILHSTTTSVRKEIHKLKKVELKKQIKLKY